MFTVIFAWILVSATAKLRGEITLFDRRTAADCGRQRRAQRALLGRFLTVSEARSLDD
jgi:hypothetical protein